MLKRGFIPYIVGGCIIGFIFVFYVVYREYQDYVKLKTDLSDAQAFNRSVEHGEIDEHVHLINAHTHGSGNTDSSAKGDTTSSSFFKGKEGNEYVYEVNGIPMYSNIPMSDEAAGALTWVKTGKMTPGAEYSLATRPNYRHKVVQRVVTPDGQLHNVIVPSFSMYEEGDVILESEIKSARHLLEGPSEPKRLSFNIDGVDYPMPEEYYTIEDRYAREVYFEKFRVSIERGISMEEVDKQIEAGEISLAKLSDLAQHSIEQLDKQMERAKMLLPEMPILSDKPPVKVNFLPDEGKDALPGWRRKMQSPFPSREGDKDLGEAYSEADAVSERIIDEDVVDSDVPFSPSELPGKSESTPSSPSVSDLEKQLAPVGIEAELTEGLSPERFDKAQQLVDQYGTVEGLRRLREVDPEAARRFEREHLRSESSQPSEPSRDVPDGEGLQR